MISVVIPIYNVGKYSEKYISSVASQSYKNLEIVALIRAAKCMMTGRNEILVSASLIRRTKAQESSETLASNAQKMLDVAIKTGSDLVGRPPIIESNDGTHRKIILIWIIHMPREQFAISFTRETFGEI